MNPDIVRQFALATRGLPQPQRARMARNAIIHVLAGQVNSAAEEEREAARLYGHARMGGFGAFDGGMEDAANAVPGMAQGSFDVAARGFIDETRNGPVPGGFTPDDGGEPGAEQLAGPIADVAVAAEGFGGGLAEGTEAGSGGASAGGAGHANQIRPGLVRTQSSGRGATWYTFDDLPRRATMKRESGQHIFENPRKALFTGMEDANKKAQREYFNNPRRAKKFKNRIPELGIEVYKARSPFARRRGERKRPDRYTYRVIVGRSCIGPACPARGRTGSFGFFSKQSKGVVMRAHMHNNSADPSPGDEAAFRESALEAMAYSDFYEEWIGVYTRSGPPRKRRLGRRTKQTGSK